MNNFLLNKKNIYIQNKKTLVLDLDETLVHSSFTYIENADFSLEVIK